MYCVKITIIGFCAFFIRVAWPYISWTGVAWMNYCLVAPISARSSLSVLCCAVPNKEIITKRELPIFKWPQMTADHHESVLPKNSFETAVKRNSNFSVKLQKCISCSVSYIACDFLCVHYLTAQGLYLKVGFMSWGTSPDSWARAATFTGMFNNIHKINWNIEWM